MLFPVFQKINKTGRGRKYSQHGRFPQVIIAKKSGQLIHGFVKDDVSRFCLALKARQQLSFTSFERLQGMKLLLIQFIKTQQPSNPDIGPRLTHSKPNTLIVNADEQSEHFCRLQAVCSQHILAVIVLDPASTGSESIFSKNHFTLTRHPLYPYSTTVQSNLPRFRGRIPDLLFTLVCKTPREFMCAAFITVK